MLTLQATAGKESSPPASKVVSLLDRGLPDGDTRRVRKKAKVQPGQQGKKQQKSPSLDELIEEVDQEQKANESAGNTKKRKCSGP